MTQSPTQIDIEKLRELLATFMSEPPSLEFASYAYNRWRAEIEGAGNALLESVPSLLSTLKSQAARVAELEGVLRPFDALLTKAEADFTAADEAIGGPITDNDAVTVTIGQLRAARNALSPTTTEDQHG